MPAENEMTAEEVEASRAALSRAKTENEDLEKQGAEAEEKMYSETAEEKE